MPDNHLPDFLRRLPVPAPVRQQLRERYPGHVAFARRVLADHGVAEREVDNEVVISDTLIARQLEVVFEEKVPMFAAGLERIGYAAREIMYGGANRVLAHASSGPALQQNLVCVLDGEAS